MSEHPTPASPEAIAAFLDAARKAVPGARISPVTRQKCIGGSPDIVERILAGVRAGDKTGTFSPVWLHDHKSETRPTIAENLVLCDFHGTPRILLTTTALEVVAWRDIGPQHTALDGPAIRALDVWRPMHWNLWKGQLAQFGVEATEDMPICVEKFSVLYSPAHA